MSAEDIPILESFGLTFTGDRRCLYSMYTSPIQLPDGWHWAIASETRHEQRWMLRDDRGRNRAERIEGVTIYEPPHYSVRREEPWACLAALPRFRIRSVDLGPIFTCELQQFNVIDADGEKVVLVSDRVGRIPPSMHQAVGISSEESARLRAWSSSEHDRAYHQCLNWLTQRYPHWKDKSAYWNGLA